MIFKNFSFLFISPSLLGAGLFSYLVGAIPTGFWFAKFVFNIDITKLGSGNIGATNVARVLGSKKYFFLIFFLDFLKAFFCLAILKIFLGNYFTQEFLLFCAVFLLLGNAYSVFIRFKGGKGVATTLGILAFLFPWLFLIFLLCWGLIIFFTKRVDLASLLAIYFSTIVYLLFSFLTGEVLCIDGLFILFLSLWLTLRHRENIKRFYC